MNKLPVLAVFALLSLAWVTPHARAQDKTSVPPPKAPFVATVPDGSRWSVEIHSPSTGKPEKESVGKPGTPDQAKPKVSLPVRVERLVGRNHLQQNTVTYSDGRTQVYYIVGNYILQKYENSEKIALLQLDSGGPDSLDSLRVASFPAALWVSMRTYSGGEKIGNDDCYHYVGGDAEKAYSPPDTTIQAWIRAADTYPVRAQVGTTIYDFSPVTPFPQDVELPPAYQEALKRLQAQLGTRRTGPRVAGSR